MNNSLKVISLSTIIVCILVLSGCGKKIPECGDPAVQKLVHDLYVETSDKDAKEFANDLIAYLGNDITYLGEKPKMTVKVTPTLTLEGFSSVSKDKNVALNSCTASSKGKAVSEITLQFSGNAISEDLKLEQKLNDPFASNPFASLLLGRLGHEGEGRAAILAKNVLLGKLSPYKNFSVTQKEDVITVSAEKPVSGSVNYSAVTTDDGDHVLVTVVSF